MSNSKNLSVNMQNKLEDIRSKMSIAGRILTICQQEEGYEKRSITDVDEAMLHYTDYQIVNAVDTVPFDRPFQHWLAEQNEECHQYDEVRQVIVDYYITKRTIPIQRILMIFKRKYNEHCRSTLQRDIERSGFIWVGLPTTQNSIIVEKPQLAFKRHQYLQQIIKYREYGRNIVYIEEVDLTGYNYQNNTQHIFIAASGKGIISACPVHINNKSIEEYIQNYIAPVIPNDSVIVMVETREKQEKINEVPKDTSLKREMIQWLTDHNISSDETQHRSELFSLIQKCRRKCEPSAYKLDGILKTYGHVVLRCPRVTTSSLQFFRRFLNDLKMYGNSLIGISEAMSIKQVESLYSTLDWGVCEGQLITKEKAMYREDMEMEVIIDQLMAMAKYGSIPTVDLAKLDTGVSVDHLLSDVFVL